MWAGVFFRLTAVIESEIHFQLQLVEGFLLREVGQEVREIAGEIVEGERYVCTW